MRRAGILLIAGLIAACVGGATRAPDPGRCEALFLAYDDAARNFASQSWNDFGLVPPGPLSRPIQNLRNNGCVTMSEDLDGMSALAARLAPYTIDRSGPAIRAVPVHLGIVTSIYDEGRVTQFFRGLGYRSRGIGAEGLGRRIYIGPFTTQGGLDQALALARKAGFIAPFPATRTRF
jgi:hypothetical protein